MARKHKFFFKNIFYLPKNQCPNNKNNTAAATSSCMYITWQYAYLYPSVQTVHHSRGGDVVVCVRYRK